jgi:hypothetical protein
MGVTQMRIDFPVETNFKPLLRQVLPSAPCPLRPCFPLGPLPQQCFLLHRPERICGLYPYHYRDQHGLVRKVASRDEHSQLPGTSQKRRQRVETETVYLCSVHATSELSDQLPSVAVPYANQSALVRCRCYATAINIQSDLS